MTLVERLRGKAARIACAILVLGCGDPTGPFDRSLRPILFIGLTDKQAIYSIRPDGTDLRLLTTGSGNARYPTWSRDGSTIGFVSGDGTEIWSMNADGTGAHRWPDLPKCSGGYYASPSWSPTADRIVAACSEDVRVMPLISGTWYSLSERMNARFVNPDWSPIGDRLLVGQHFSSDLFAVQLDAGTAPTLLMTNAGDAAWSPDGNRVAFVTATGESSSIYVANADGTQRMRLTTPDSTNLDEGPTWSSDGRWIAFHRYYSVCNTSSPEPIFSRTCTPHWAIYVVGADGTGLRRVTPDSLTATRPAW